MKVVGSVYFPLSNAFASPDSVNLFAYGRGLP